jgi:CheY-like chemotaxis protein
MVDFKVAMRTTVLLVDDDIQQLELRSLVLKTSGFTVLTAPGAVEAMSIMEEHAANTVDVAVLDYHMPVMNGCVLAEYLRARYPELKIVLHSGAFDISESEMRSIDAFVPKADGVTRLLEEVSLVAQLRTGPLQAVAMHEVSLIPGADSL